MSWIWTSWGSGNDPGANNETEGVRTIEQWKKDRISELTRISRERELTAEEQTERQALREEYLASCTINRIRLRVRSRDGGFRHTRAAPMPIRANRMLQTIGNTGPGGVNGGLRTAAL